MPEIETFIAVTSVILATLLAFAVLAAAWPID